MVTFCFAETFPLLFNILTLNLPFLFSLNVKSLLTINEFIVTVFVTVSDVFELMTESEYDPGFKSIATLTL